jgi:aryl-alcohol dehydrogenase-like predicted oxidoreductase
MWGGTDERESIRTIHASLDKGINLIDTAAFYGFGVSEEIVGTLSQVLGGEDSLWVASFDLTKTMATSLTQAPLSNRRP